MRAKLFLMVTCLVCTTTSYGFRGDGVGNGGGIGENNFVFAYYNLDEFLGHALAGDDNDILINERNILTTMKRTLPEEYKQKEPLRFLSGSKNPRIFIYPFGKPRVAVTGSKVGTPILINTDFLYYQQGNQIKAITIAQALSVLVHELGHHQGIKDELFLNTLGAKVAKTIYKKSEKRFLRETKNIFLEYINLGDKSNVQVLITDSLNSFDLSKDLQSKTRCPGNIIPKSIEIWQSQWTKYSSPSWYLKNQLVLNCATSDGAEAVGGLEYWIIPTFIYQNQKIRIQKVQTYIKQCDFGTPACLAKQVEAEKYLENKKYDPKEGE